MTRAKRQRTGNAPLIVILGQTASGKTALGIEVAEKVGGEIICADSRTIYKGMDIGTAKPTLEDQARVKHHCIDLIDPDEIFSAADFKAHALRAIDNINARGKIPIMVGGTGLYIDAVLFDYSFGGAANPSLRSKLSDLSIEQLQDIIRERGYTMPENYQNKRYLIRAIERKGVTGKRLSLRQNTLVIGLETDKDTLRNRITQRARTMFARGIIEEYRLLLRKFPKDSPGFLVPGYKALAPYLDGKESIDDAVAAVIHNDIQLAKRQRTWFRRNDCIQWVSDRSKVVDIVTTFLNK